MNRLRRPLEHRCQPLPAADAHRLEAVADVAAVHLARQRRQDATAGGADRVPERDARAVDVEPLEIGPGSGPTPARRRAPGPRRPRSARSGPCPSSASSAACNAFATAGTGPIPMVAGGTPPTPHDTSRTSGRNPSSAARAGWVTTQIAAPSFCPLALPGRDRGVRVVAAEDRAQGRELLHRRVGADVLVGVDDGLTPAALHHHRHDLVGEPALVARRGGALVRCGRRTRPARRAGWSSPGGGSRPSRACRRAPGS